MENQKEKYNDEGLSEKSKITILIYSFEFLDEKFNQEYNEIAIRVSNYDKNDVSQTTFKRSADIINYNDNFDL